MGQPRPRVRSTNLPSLPKLSVIIHKRLFLQNFPPPHARTQEVYGTLERGVSGGFGEIIPTSVVAGFSSSLSADLRSHLNLTETNNSVLLSLITNASVSSNKVVGLCCVARARRRRTSELHLQSSATSPIFHRTSQNATMARKTAGKEVEMEDVYARTSVGATAPYGPCHRSYFR